MAAAMTRHSVGPAQLLAVRKPFRTQKGSLDDQGALPHTAATAKFLAVASNQNFILSRRSNRALASCSSPAWHAS